MKVVSTEALTKLVQLIKSSFISVDDTEQTSEIETETPSEITLATVATTGDYDDLINTPDLTLKADVDLSNINPSASAKETIVSWEDVDWSSEVDITSLSSYNCPSSGYLRLYTVYNGYIYYSSDQDQQSTGFGYTYNTVGASGRSAMAWFRVQDGEVLTKGDIYGASKAFFYPVKGVA